MNVPNALALAVTLDNAFTASSLLPVISTLMMALLPTVHLLHVFYLVLQ